MHDNEPLVAAIADPVVKVTGGTSTGTKPGRHAPVAERGVRAIKEGALTAELHTQSVSGLTLLDDDLLQMAHSRLGHKYLSFAMPRRLGQHAH